MKYKSLNNNFIVKLLPEETTSGLILTTVQKPYKRVEVVEGIGELNKGDVLLIDQYAGIDYKYNEEKTMIVNKRDVLIVE